MRIYPPARLAKSSMTVAPEGAGAGRVLNRLGTPTNEIPLPHPERSREWLNVALVECGRCHQVVARTSPIQRHCPECRRALKGARSREAVRRRRFGA
jgi:hypothetical protein